ncbi:hypothetical protein [Rickettsia endosymbiont of Polydrusus tereticollis]|uniref:hypothetical protein n=1 Tax=Rickettsia endosymbiont of Polydrusus tereticollis TaxID=3066251 RepID=UPI0031332F2D
MNDQVLQRIIDTHPEINSKEQAVRWIQAHGMEAGNIAREIIDPVNKIGNAHINNVESQVQSLSDIHSNVSNAYSNSPTKAELNSKYNSNAKKFAETPISSSTTRNTQSLAENTENDVDIGQKMYNTGYPEGTSLQNLRGTITKDKDKIKREFENTPASDGKDVYIKDKNK